jgi:murein DD-endopeptidase MepM/ murein hydrolase activator NlpD
MTKRFGLTAITTIILISAPMTCSWAACNSLDDSATFKNKFACPVSGGGQVRGPDDCASTGGRFSSTRGTGHLHHALDINTAEGTGVLATKPGRVAVAAANWDVNGGSTVIIDHEDGDYTIYMHLKDVQASPGDCVRPGDSIGSVGYTGNASCLKDKGLTAHLHFAIVRAAAIGLADGSGPISAALKNADDWLALSPEFFGNDNLDLGIKDPQPILGNVSGCLN